MRNNNIHLNENLNRLRCNYEEVLGRKGKNFHFEDEEVKH